MKFDHFLAVALLGCFCSCTPVPAPDAPVTSKITLDDAIRAVNYSSSDWTGIISKEFSLGGCRDIIFAFARGSQEVGNMGTIVGPPLSNGLKYLFGPKNVATEGIDYDAAVITNYYPKEADPVGVNAMIATLTIASSICPDSVIVASGYSQGAAICHRGIEFLPDEVKDAIDGVVTFGDTQTYQDGGQIANFPKDKVDIICNSGDLVCDGTLWVILPIHLDYARRVPEALLFLANKIIEVRERKKLRTGQPPGNQTSNQPSAQSPTGKVSLAAPIAAQLRP